MIYKSLFKSIVCFFTLSLMGASTHAATILSTFGSDIQAVDLQGSWVNNYNSSTSTITATDSPGSGISHYPVTGWNITGVTRISLIGSVATSPGASSSFKFTLEDINGKLATSTDFYWSEFGSSSTEVFKNLNFASGFDYTNVIGWNLYTSGIGTALITSFNQLSVSAVPEPTSLLLLGMGLAGIAMRRSLRRR